jgi:1,4-dihydroxy-6-naphthoate synthase
MKNLSLAYSPCPNDTFLFYHLVHSPILKNFKLNEVLQDVEKLNQAALVARFDFTKLSFFAYFHVMDNYEILNTGSALGRGCGPLLVQRKGNKSNPKNKKILVPGLLTTANLLTKIFLENQYEPIPIRYDLVVPTLQKGDYDFGVIIHEERFTYEEKGMEKIVDLGEYWEGISGLPIPLGAITANRKLDYHIKKEFDSSLNESLNLAYQNPDLPKNYIKNNAQEKNDSIIQNHIDLYVNEYTKDLGSEGKKSIEALYLKCLELGIIQSSKNELFIQ